MTRHSADLLLEVPPREQWSLYRWPESMSTILRYGAPQAPLPVTWDAWLCTQLGILPQQDWPVAPLSCLASNPQACQGYWLCATPLYLHLQRDHFVAHSVPGSGLDLARAQEVIAAFNQHFQSRGLQFYAADANCWYLRTDTVPRLSTTPLSVILGQSTQGHLPQGEDALYWHQLLNEMQMLLHVLLVEETEATACNSLWLWGGGVLSQAEASSAQVEVWGDTPMLQGWSQWQKTRLHPLDNPDALPGWNTPASHLVVLDTTPETWVNRYALGEKSCVWLKTLVAAVRAGALSQLNVYLSNGDAICPYRLTRRSFWKFWRTKVNPAVLATA